MYPHHVLFATALRTHGGYVSGNMFFNPAAHLLAMLFQSACLGDVRAALGDIITYRLQSESLGKFNFKGVSSLYKSFFL